MDSTEVGQPRMITGDSYISGRVGHLNHNNPGPIDGDIASPLFGLSNQIAGGPNGEGVFETANNRRLEMQVRFAF